MNKLKDVIKDILYVSKLTVKNKKIIITTSIALSQLTAATDLALIAVFAAVIAKQFTNIEFVNTILNYFIEYKVFIIFLVVFRYILNYFQFAILKKIELEVLVNLRSYMFKKVLEQRNHSNSDSYYFINTLCAHIAFFYSGFASFLNYFLQGLAYAIYLLFADIQLISFFGIGVIVLAYPITKLIKTSKEYMHKSFLIGKDAHNEMVNVIENLSLIKILRMESYQINKFRDVLIHIKNIIFKNEQVSFLNKQLPNIFTLLIFSIIINIPQLVGRLTLDILGVTIRLFQSVSNVSDSINKIANSQVHIKEFVQIEKGMKLKNENYFKVDKNSGINLENISFKYINSETYIFKNLNLNIDRNTHNIIIGSNGSGKSTLLGLIGNVLRPEKGTLTSYSEKFGYIGASPFIFATTLKENLIYGNKNEISDRKIIEMMKKFEVFKEKDGYDLNRKIDSASLSSGQMQKIAFIRALLSNPEILLLDESISNLDDFSKELVLDIISNQKITVINSTHDPEKYNNIDSVFKLDVKDEIRTINRIN